MKFLLFFVLVQTTLDLKATNFYVDPSATASAKNGTAANPWTGLTAVNKSMAYFKAGDTVFFKRGEMFVGKLNITCSGKYAAPVVFMPYGNAAAAPLFQYALPDGIPSKGRSVITLYNNRYVAIDGLKISDTTMDANDHTITARVGYALILKNCVRITLSNLDISLVGIGLELGGDSNLVENCRIQNLRMVVNNRTTRNDDYGAVAIVLGGAHNKINNNLLMDCWAASYDYKFDGGAIEIFGAATNGNTIKNNLAINCNGFMECGSATGGESKNNLVTGNVLINNGLLCYIHRSGKFGLLVNNLQFQNNLVIETAQRLTKPSYLLGIGAGETASQKIIFIKNNIFWLTSGIDVIPAGSKAFIANQFAHEGNIYYLKTGSLNFKKLPTETVFTNQSLKPADLLPASFYHSFNWLLPFLGVQ